MKNLMIMLSFCFLPCTYAMYKRNTSPEEQKIDQKLRHAIVSADKDTIIEFLAGGGNVERVINTFTQHTLLMYAAHFGKEEICALLIAAGADVNARDAEDLTPLILAQQKPELYRMLIEAGADVNAQCANGYSALMIAAQVGEDEACEFLISQGALLHLKTERNTSALLEAAENKHEKTCLLLVEHQKKQELPIITMLHCLKKLNGQCPALLYRQAKTLLGPHLKEHTVAAMLNVRESHVGKCAYDCLPLEWLKPSPIIRPK